MTIRPPQAAAKPKVHDHVRGPGGAVTLGSIARDISVPAATPRMCASPQASCGGTCKLRWGSGQATGPRAVWMATVCNSGLSRGVGLLPGSLCRFGRDLELLRGGLLRLVRSCSCLLGSRSQIGGRPHWLGCTQCFAGVYAEGPAPAAASASHRERSRSAGAVLRVAACRVPPRTRQFLRAIGSSSAQSASDVQFARLAK